MFKISCSKKTLLLCAVTTSALAVGAVEDACAAGDDLYLLNQPVEQRTDKDFAARGASYHGFVLKPQLEGTIGYNDNIYATKEDTESDMFGLVTPSLRIKKEYGPHSFTLSGNAKIYKYNSLSDENRTALDTATTGDVYLGHDYTLHYLGNWDRDHLSRTGQSGLTEKPVAVETARGELGLSKRFNRLQLSLIQGLTRKTYDNGILKDTGATEIYDDGNRNIEATTLRAGYDISGNTDAAEHTIFTEVSRSRTMFDDKNDDGTSQDSTQHGGLVGLKSNYKGLVFGRIAFGYFKRKFDNFDSVGRMDMDADLKFNVTPKMTLNLLASRDLLQDNGYKDGYVNTDFSGGFDYELQHNAYIGFTQAYNNREYLGENEGREDDLHTSSIFLRYNHSPYLESNLSFAHAFRDSNQSDNNFDRNIVMYTLTGRY